MKLYEAKPKSWVKVLTVDGPTRVPPVAPPIEDGEVIFFHKIDGMYSLCENKFGDMVHLVAWAEVEVADDPRE